MRSCIVLDRFIEVRLPQIPATADSYKNKIEKHVRPAFQDMRMCDIDRPAVETWLNSKEQAGYSHNTLLDLRKVLSAIFSKAAEWKMWTGDNPCSKIRVNGKREVFRKTLPKDDGINSFLTAIKDSVVIPADGARLIVLTAIGSGLRVCEVLGLQVWDIDTSAGTVTVQRDWTSGRVGPTKTEESRRTRRLPGPLTEALKSYAQTHGKSDADFIFGRKDKEGLPPDDRDLQQHVFRPAAKAAGIYTPGFGLRRFRHVNITWRQEAGAHPLEAMKAAGHTQLSTTWLYTQTDIERERKQVQEIWNRLHPSETNWHGTGTGFVQ
jgi:integrase